MEWETESKKKEKWTSGNGKRKIKEEVDLKEQKIGKRK